ncbi:hypothetical protein JWG45_20810 [Leptospira sp. 201903070]|uniref:Uncharacterized protein n=1 Tax=Leptospira ainlahdjerensis TaxID=2810033 RepID=A0ABS2UGU8_9LEPT|nr:hypothetical protein [Leptospira ainlahdjerensis]MBM9579591.1 hypothetical protein [Leptospira ainlahdjerensis]
MDSKNFFIQTVSQFLRFLNNDYNFIGPIVEEKKEINFVNVYFFKKNLAIELILDCRDEIFECKISKLIDERIPENYALDDKGMLVRQSLSQLLMFRGVRKNLHTKRSNLPFDKRIKIQLQDYIKMLKEYGSDIPEDKLISLGK